jgi:DNA-binding transcriptional LysR family regulator
LGVLLFTRGSRSVRLTPAGDDFLVHAKRIATEVTLSKEKMQEYTNYQKGHIRIGITPYMSYLGIYKLLAEFLHFYVNMEFRLYIDSTESLLKGMREKKAMLAFVTSPHNNEFEVDFYPILKERLILLVSCENALAAKQQVDIEDLAQDPFLFCNDSRYYMNEMYSLYGVNLKTIGVCNDVHMVKSFVEENLGITLIGEHIASNLTTDKILAIPLVQKFEYVHGLAVPKQKRLPLSTKTLRDFILKKAQTPFMD